MLTAFRIVNVEDIPISAFKANCSALIERIDKTGESLRVTRHGRPIVDVIPVAPARKRYVVGDMAGTAEIVGDIVSPIIDLDDFEAYRD
jgi:prevent-host-death family protein